MSTPVKFKLRMVKFLEDPLTDSTPNKYAKEFSSVRMGFARDMMDGTIPIDMNQDVKVLNEFVNNLTLDEVGHIEDRLGDVRRLFNNANVEFSVEWGYY